MSHQQPPTGQQGWPPQPIQPEPAAVRRRLPWRWIAAVVAALVVGGAVGASGDSGGGKPAAGPTTVTVTVTPSGRPPAVPAPTAKTVTVVKTVTVTPKATAVIPGDGVFLVGSDIRPGMYRSAGGDGCYWARLRTTAGDLGGIIANGNPTGPALVTVASTDKAFETARCAPWSRIG